MAKSNIAQAKRWAAVTLAIGLVAGGGLCGFWKSVAPENQVYATTTSSTKLFNPQTQRYEDVPDEDVPDFLRYGLSTIDANVRVPVRFKTGELKFVLGRDLPEAIRKLDGSIVHPPELQKEDYDAKFRRRYGDDFFTVAFGAEALRAVYRPQWLPGSCCFT